MTRLVKEGEQLDESIKVCLMLACQLSMPLLLELNRFTVRLLFCLILRCWLSHCCSLICLLPSAYHRNIKTVYCSPPGLGFSAFSNRCQNSLTVFSFTVLKTQIQKYPVYQFVSLSISLFLKCQDQISNLHLTCVKYDQSEIEMYVIDVQQYN